MPPPPLPTLRVTRPSPGVTLVEMNRPDKANAFNWQMWLDFRACFEHLALDGETRCIVLAGAGERLFTAGLDLGDPLVMQNVLGGGGGGDGEGADVDAARRAFRARRTVMAMQESFTAMERCPQPVIAAVHGACIGAGMDCVTAADIRLCSKTAVFSVREVAIGLAADVGTLQRIERVMGASRARELCFTARNMDAGEALACGLVSRVLDSRDALLDAALAMAKTIAAHSPVAVAGTKANLNFSRGRPVEEALERMATWNGAFLQTDDLAKAGAAAMIKGAEPPTFGKL